MTIVDFMLIWGVSASLAYWFVLLLRLPAWVWYPSITIILITCLHFLSRRYTFNLKFISTSKKWAIALLLTCIVSASTNIFTNRPDSDDIAFSHRAVVAASNLSMPFAMTETALDVDNIPPIMPLKIFTSIEVTTSLVAKALGVSQILALHMGLGSLVNFMLPAIYFLLLRFFRVPIPYAVIGTIGTIAFFMMSGNVHRDWGNFTIMRSWQGKCILMELILPITLLYSLRFFLYGRRSDIYRLHAVTCCGIGLSGTALFLVPFIIGTSAVAVWVSTGFCRRSLLRAAISSSILIQIIFVSVLPWIGLLPPLGDISWFKTGGWHTDIAKNLGLVFHENSLPLYLAYLITAFLLRKKTELISLLAYITIAIMFLTIPGINNLLMSIVTPGAYWRFSYALFVPVFVGLAIAGASRYIKKSGTVRLIGIAWLSTLIIATWAIKKPAINQQVISLPGAKFNRNAMTQSYHISKLADVGAIVLAPVSIVPSLGLLRPDIKFIVARPGETFSYFNHIGRWADGKQRADLGIALESCDFSNINKLLSRDIWPNMQLVIYPTLCNTDVIRTILTLGSDWRDITLNGYNVLVKT